MAKLPELGRVSQPMGLISTIVTWTAVILAFEPRFRLRLDGKSSSRSFVRLLVSLRGDLRVHRGHGTGMQDVVVLVLGWARKSSCCGRGSACLNIIRLDVVEQVGCVLG
jgi:hypothetical protein